ncbi:hypothetical protein [Altererythrobacter lutimaris]|uniref:Uncharacterized protein n=1 Tax=Altererythrobacter lutimaris TaxID=2743979 RepID=A0A850HCJ2_9SPHN|nr:hypothetical protein [Altererythrobacter lutimaris]NVE95025.1 hypothetical protein [Altererythrobacter lutimaris]
MIKKLLLLTVVAVFGLWLAGYDMATISAMISGAADSSAGQMSGRNTLEDGGWGG